MNYKRFLVRLSDRFSNVVNNMCQIKTEDELNSLRKAARIADEIFTQVSPQIKPGVSEQYISELFDACVTSSEASKLAFDTIIAAGPNAAFPHAVPSSRIIQPDDIVVIDFGVVYESFNSDMTRTLLMNPLDKKSKLIYNLVYEAQRMALEHVRAGFSIRKLDELVRDYFDKNGFRDYFIHGLGHGVGFKIHEKPFINQKSEGILKTNMVITIEPGIYLPGYGGVRIEDTVIVKADGYELITKSIKNNY